MCQAQVKRNGYSSLLKGTAPKHISGILHMAAQVAHSRVVFRINLKNRECQPFLI